jgi:Na+-translocating ferredoxin:NAD+ oxidoreductase RnfG subunit
MIYQIAGLVITVTAAVCGTVFAIMYTKEKTRAERMDRAQRIAATRAIVENGLHAMYEQERALRIAAETTVNTKEFIINQKDKEIERLKGLLKLAEENK